MNIKWEVEYYSTPAGKLPAKGFVENLPVKLRVRLGNDRSRILYFSQIMKEGFQNEI